MLGFTHVYLGRYRERSEAIHKAFNSAGLLRLRLAMTRAVRLSECFCLSEGTVALYDDVTS